MSIIVGSNFLHYAERITSWLVDASADSGIFSMALHFSGLDATVQQGFRVVISWWECLCVCEVAIIEFTVLLQDLHNCSFAVPKRPWTVFSLFSVANAYASGLTWLVSASILPSKLSMQQVSLWIIVS